MVRESILSQQQQQLEAEKGIDLSGAKTGALFTGLPSSSRTVPPPPPPLPPLPPPVDVFAEAWDEVSQLLQRDAFAQFRTSEAFLCLKTEWEKKVRQAVFWCVQSRGGWNHEPQELCGRHTCYTLDGQMLCTESDRHGVTINAVFQHEPGREGVKVQGIPSNLSGKFVRWGPSAQRGTTTFSAILPAAGTPVSLVENPSRNDRQ